MPERPAEPPPITLGEFAEWWLDYITGRERKNYWRKASSYVRNIIDEPSLEATNCAKILVQIECEEGDLNPDSRFRGGESHSFDSSAESRPLKGVGAQKSRPALTQLTLDFTPKTGTVPAVKSAGDDRKERTRKR
jgi:hypothetical protein